MRKFLLVAAALVAGAVSFALYNLKAEVGRSADNYAADIKERTGAELEIGELGFDLVPFPAVELRRLVIKAPKGRASDLEVDVVRVYPRLLPLLVGRVSVRRLRASGAGLSVVKNASGNIETLSLSMAGLTSAGTGGRITIDRSRLLIEDRSGPEPARLEIRDLELEIRADAQGTDFKLEGTPLGRGSRLRASGRIEGGQDGGQIELAFDLRRGRVEALVAAFPSLALLMLKGPVAITGTVSGPLGPLSLRGSSDSRGESDEGPPVEPLKLSIKAGAELGLFGSSHDAGLEAELALDGRRLLLRKGKLAWAGLRAALSGWTQTVAGGRMSLRLTFEEVDLSEQLARLGVEGPWRAEALLDGVLRIDGNRGKPRLSYRVVADRGSFSHGSWVAADCGPLEVSGNIAAINADVSASFVMEDLDIGQTRLETARLGLVYWRDKLTVTSLETPAFDGKFSLSAALYPRENWRLEGGAVLTDLDPGALAALFSLATDGLPSGRLDALVHFGRDSGAAWTKARVGVHLGSFPGRSPLNLLATGLTASSVSEDDEAGSWPFERLAFDAERSGDGWRLAAVAVETEQGRLEGEGRVDGQGELTLTGRAVLDEVSAAAIAELRPALATLIGEDGTLVVPVEIEGGREGFKLRAAATAIAAGPRTDIEMDLPSLEEHFGR